MAAGRYGEALVALGEAVAVGPAPVRAAALVVRAGLLREVSLHARAEVDDRAALVHLQAWPRLTAAVRIGLVADAIGLVSPEPDQRVQLDHRLRTAAAAVGDPPVSWQAATRLDWVRGEVAMLRDDPTDARRRFADAAARARNHGSLRMAAKGTLFEAAACDAAGDRGAAATCLARADALARRAHAMALLWPIALLAGDRQRADAILRGLVDELPEPLRTEARQRTTYPV